MNVTFKDINWEDLPQISTLSVSNEADEGALVYRYNYNEDESTYFIADVKAEKISIGDGYVITLSAEIEDIEEFIRLVVDGVWGVEKYTIYDKDGWYRVCIQGLPVAGCRYSISGSVTTLYFFFPLSPSRVSERVEIKSNSTEEFVNNLKEALSSC